MATTTTPPAIINRRETILKYLQVLSPQPNHSFKSPLRIYNFNYYSGLKDGLQANFYINVKYK